MSILHAFAALIALAVPTAPADDPPAKKLAMSEPVACSKIQAFGDYVELEDVVLTRDDKLLIYYEPSGYAYEVVGKEYRVHLVQDAKIRRRGKKPVIQAKDKILDYKGHNKDGPFTVYLTNTISL